jgi:hypothetical protein
MQYDKIEYILTRYSAMQRLTLFGNSSKISLVQAISTPPQKLITKLEIEGRVVMVGDQKIKRIPIGSGGFNDAYLYQKVGSHEYRVLKVLQEEDKRYGGIERRVEVFNQIYNTIYDKQLSSLATARVLPGSKMEMDMPYICGEDFNEATDGIELLNVFKANRFFITDHDVRGNIVIYEDKIRQKKYALIRDVDLVCSRMSFEKNKENSVTHTIMSHGSQPGGVKENNLCGINLCDIMTVDLQSNFFNPMPTEIPQTPKGKSAENSCYQCVVM